MIYRLMSTTVLATTMVTVFSAPVDTSTLVQENQTKWQKSKLFNTKILAVPAKVENILISNKYKFKKSTFLTPDGLRLECLVRSVQNPTCTIIVSAGFFPGLMTGMASLVKLLPHDCNIIFYNGRGKGASEGYRLPQLWNFGTHEYKDVIGAMDYAKQINKDVPIIIYGTCAGTFANTKALCSLPQDDLKQKYNVRAHIIDSAVVHLPETIERIPEQFHNPATWRGWLWTKFLWFLRYTIFLPRFMTSGGAAHLDPKALAETKIPTLHIDCKEGDKFTPYSATSEFYREHMYYMDSKEHCIQHTFEKSSHANHVLKHKHVYAAVLANFIHKNLE